MQLIGANVELVIIIVVKTYNDKTDCMKGPLTCLFIFFLINVIYAQDARTILENELVEVLESDGILLTPGQKACEGDCRPGSPWKNARQKEKALKKDTKLKTLLLQKKFSPPTFVNGKTVAAEYIFPDKSVGKIGSFLIDGNDLSIINNSVEPLLPVLTTGNQLSIPNPSDDNSNYVLNYVSTKLFKGGIEGEIDAGFRDYFNLKAQSSLNLSNEERSQISIGAGNFKNQLGILFQKTIANELEAKDFMGIYYLWIAYRNNQVKATDKVIQAFDGMCFFSSKGVENASDFKFNTQLNSSGKFPFLSYGLDASAKWDNSTSLSKQGKIFTVCMFSPPSLIRVPTPDEILTNWKRLNNISNEIVFPSSNTIPASKPLVVQITFGPLPNSTVAKAVRIDQQYSLSKIDSALSFVKSIKLVTDDENRIKPANDGYYTYDLEITRNEDFLQNNFSSLSHILKASFPIRLYLDVPIGEKYLEKVYDKISVETERLPNPVYNNYEVEATQEAGTGRYVYKATISFSTPNNTLIPSSPPIRITEVFGLPPNIDQAFKSDITKSLFSPKGSNDFELKFSIASDSKYFDVNNRSYDVEILIEFSSQGSTYKRKLPVRLLGPDNQIAASASSNITSNITLRDNGELLKNIDKSATLTDGRTVSNLITKYTDPINNSLDLIGFVEELKQFTDLTITTGNQYSINPKYLEVERLNIK